MCGLCQLRSHTCLVEAERSLPWGVLGRHNLPLAPDQISHMSTPLPIHATPTLPFPLSSLVRRTHPTPTELLNRGILNSGYIRRGGGEPTSLVSKQFCLFARPSDSPELRLSGVAPGELRLKASSPPRHALHLNLCEPPVSPCLTTLQPRDRKIL